MSVIAPAADIIQCAAHLRTPRPFALSCCGQVLATLLLAVALAAATPETVAPLPPAATSLESLQQQLAGLLSEPRFQGALWGVKIVSLDTGRTLFAHAAERRMSPASNSKLYTGALALATLGADYRISTPLRATAVPDQRGVLAGDLIIAGRGDPSWNPRAAKADFWTVFDPFIATLRRAGVTRITGQIVADATYLRGPPQGASWTADDMDFEYGAEISAISLADNYVDLRIVPAPVSGQPCAIEVLQPLSGLVLANHTTTGPAGSERVIRLQRLPGENTVHLFGQLPAGGEPELTEAPVPRPATWFATALREALRRAGITVEGEARSRRWPDEPARGDVILGEIISPPLSTLVAGFMIPSQNLETDLIFAHLGEQRRTPATPAWRRSDELAVTALEEFLGASGIPAGAVQFDEGSGLSRNNLTTAAATVELLTVMARHPAAPAFRAALPRAGADGTLGKRMKGTAAENNVRAKTGTLRWANSLSGYVTTAAGERLAFSLMLNRYVAPPLHKGGEELDDIAIMLARYAGPK
ncbi:MAG: D-alanyl-D-alanine carboxypeptidase/D-alanyl-D-alanine-endopeptidase [Opitutae bacterium]